MKTKAKNVIVDQEDYVEPVICYCRNGCGATVSNTEDLCLTCIEEYYDEFNTGNHDG